MELKQFKNGIMITIKYKTIKGLLRQSGQMTIGNFFNGMFYNLSRHKVCKFSLDDKERRKVAERFAEHLLSTKKRRADLVEALMECRGDLGYFQCFYVNYNKEHGIYINNSLSGEAFEYCKRMYLKKYC